MKHSERGKWRRNGGCFYKNKLFRSKHILLFGSVHFEYVFLDEVLCLRYLPFFRHSDKPGYAIPKFTHHILVGTHQAKLFSYKIFPVSSKNC